MVWWLLRRNPNESVYPTFSGGSELALLKHGLSSDLGCRAFASANAWAEGVSGYPLARYVYIHSYNINSPGAIIEATQLSHYSIVIILVWQTPLFTCQRRFNSLFPLASRKGSI